MRRREFLEAAGRVGGAGAVYASMTALGLLPTSAEAHSTAGTAFDLGGEPAARGTKIIILGAGLSGMCAAYELGRKGYDCRVLEARARPGGRCHTIRRGTTETEVGGATQKCNFDEGQYFNPGPARIPQHHVTLDYCRAFGVAVEPFTQVNESAFYHHAGAEWGALGGKRIRAREIKADMYGYTHELLAKALSQSALDTEVTSEDKERLMAFLAADGSLSGGKYRGGHRRGFRTLPGAGDAVGEPLAPHALHDLLQSGLGMEWLSDYEIEWQPTLFQIVGGTDGIARAFARQLGKKITYEAQVTELRQSERGVTVVYTDKRGKAHTVAGTFCVCALPLSVVEKIKADFAPATKQAFTHARYDAAAKIGIQFKRRFWEEDDRVFGGITRTTLPITQIFYPSTGYLGKKGVLVGFYNYGADAEAVGKMTYPERTAYAIRHGSVIHPQYPKAFENAFSVAWQKVPHSRGAWMSWDDPAGYNQLGKPDGRVYFAGDHMSHITGWMAGALESARLVSRNLHERASKTPTRS